MKRVISRRRLVLLISYVILIAHGTFAETPEGLQDEFTFLRQRHREARRLAGTSPTILSQPIKGFNARQNTSSDTSSPNWAGAVQLSPASGTFDVIVGSWTLPTVSRPSYASGAGTWETAVWVGFDGAGSCTGAILQAGSNSYVDIDDNGAVTNGAYVWVEWYPTPGVSISTIPVAAGDSVQVSIVADQSMAQGTVVIDNLSTGVSDSVIVSSPGPSNNICGMTAEWIVEDPGGALGNLAPFAHFSPVNMLKCAAATTTDAQANVDGAQLLTMTQSGMNLATPYEINSHELEIMPYD